MNRPARVVSPHRIRRQAKQLQERWATTLPRRSLPSPTMALLRPLVASPAMRRAIVVRCATSTPSFNVFEATVSDANVASILLRVLLGIRPAGARELHVAAEVLVRQRVQAVGVRKAPLAHAAARPRNRRAEGEGGDTPCQGDSSGCQILGRVPLLAGAH